MFNKLIEMIIYFEISMSQMIQIKISRCLHSNSRRKIEIKFKIEFQSIKKHRIRRRQQ